MIDWMPCVPVIFAGGDDIDWLKALIDMFIRTLIWQHMHMQIMFMTATITASH